MGNRKVIYLDDALKALRPIMRKSDYYYEIQKAIQDVPPAEPERKKMSNKEWIDFLSEQFTVSRTSAKEMLHGLMKWKAEDNFKKQFSGGRNEKE